ncbi:hypothetical protein PMI11_03519 [Rhizobium sp. CF142]|nr:hypothetical protein PMI11_03519 [Rhizobium sp. CF142]
MQQSKNQPTDIEVALWQYSQDEHDWGRWMRSLSQDELERAAAYRFDRDRVAFIAGRFLLRRLLSAHTGTLPREIMLVADAQGKPSLEGRGVPQFSLANADGLVTVAVASSCDRVGIDCERAGAEIEEAALDAYCSLNERRWLDEMPARERARAAIQLWGAQGEPSEGAWRGLVRRSPERHLFLGGRFRLLHSRPGCAR